MLKPQREVCNVFACKFIGKTIIINAEKKNYVSSIN